MQLAVMPDPVTSLAIPIETHNLSDAAGYTSGASAKLGTGDKLDDITQLGHINCDRRVDVNPGSVIPLGPDPREVNTRYDDTADDNSLVVNDHGWMMQTTIL